MVYKVTGCNDIPAVMIELAKIKIKSQKIQLKYHYTHYYRLYRYIAYCDGLQEANHIKCTGKYRIILIKSDDHKTIVLQI